MAEYIEREAVLQILSDRNAPWDGYNAVKILPAADVLPIPDGGIGEVSDGYHTFNGLYYQRMVLFAALVKQNKDKSWKSLRHEDGELCFGGGWFIVGIDTPDGSYTYHYEDNFWSMFDCEELAVAPHWDGHTEKDVIRLLSLPDVQPVKHGGKWVNDIQCSNCGWYMEDDVTMSPMIVFFDYCPNCGAKMDSEKWMN